MSVFHNNSLIGSSGQGDGAYSIERSLRFNSSDSAYLSLAVPTGTSTTFTASLWIKRSSISATYKHFLFTSDTGAGCGLGWTNGNAITVYNSAHNTTSGVYRDVSAWYHITLSVNAGTATLYVNGEQQVTGVTGFQLNGTAYIGRYITNAYYFDGYMADIYLVDGEALTPSSFTEIDSNGILQPIEYTGSYGTRGFHLPFSNNSTAAALGTDTSGNGNTWTVNNISVAAGAGNDSLVDVPTNGTETDTGVGGEVRGNYATLNINASIQQKPSMSEGNLKAATASGTYAHYLPATIGVGSGKWYAEFTIDSGSGAIIGALPLNADLSSNYFSSGAGKGSGYNIGGFAFNYDNAGSIESSLTSSTAGDIIGVALDLDDATGKLFIYKNGVKIANAQSDDSFTTYNLLSVSSLWTIAIGNNATWTITANFGQRPFAYTAPSGFKALCTANLPAPTIEKGSDYFDTKLYTGNGSTQTISGLDFSPDFAWFKSRSVAENHVLSDTVRGADRQLFSNLVNAEQTNSTYVTSFTSDGFSLGNNTATGGNNINGTTYAAWCWDAGSSTVTNNDGSISSQVRANSSAGFSIVTWNGGGSGYSVGHGLGVAPKLYIIKNRDNTSDWPVFTTVIDGSLDYVYLNTTAAKGDSGSSLPTSTLVYPGQSISSNYVMYCFAPVAGYSAFGSYTGNGSTDGPFVYTGFRPRWVLIRRSDNAGSWGILDTARNTFNVQDKLVWANLSDAEGTYTICDVLSNGFKLRESTNGYNTSSGTYVWAAFAEAPFQFSRAR